MDYANNLFLGFLPYIAITAFLIGVGYHLYKQDKDIHATSTLFLKRDPLIVIGSPLFHLGIILVFFGHVFGLFTPPFMVEWFMPLATKRILAISMGGLFGLCALVGMSMLLIRKFTYSNVKRTSKFRDYFIVVLILLQICLGLLSTLHTAGAPLDEYLALDSWAQGIVWFEPESWKYIASMNLIYKLHIVNGFLIFIIFPYTKLMHMIKVPVLYLFRGNKTYPQNSAQ